MSQDGSELTTEVAHYAQAPDRRLILLLSVACATGVANVYFPQAIVPLIATSLHVRPGTAALVATAAQFGYAAGIFLLVPLGDRLMHRRVIVTLLSVCGLFLIVAGTAADLPILIAASVVIGATTVVSQIIIPMAAGLVAENRRGAVTGSLLSGLIGGILLSRTFGGSVGQWLGWRAPYLISAGAAILIAVVLAFTLPSTTPPSRDRYLALVSASVRLFRTEPDLRRSGLYQALMFAGFSAAWASLPLLMTGPAYGLGTAAVGLVALVSAATMFCTPIAGRLSDSRGPDVVTVACLIGTIAAAALLTSGGLGGGFGLVGLTAGMLVLDVSIQCGQVANQARIFAMRPNVRSRLNTAYMTCVFLGGSIGSLLGVRAEIRFGWTGVCVLVATLASVALGWHLVIYRRSRARPAPPPGRPGSPGSP